MFKFSVFALFSLCVRYFICFMYYVFIVPMMHYTA